jgi:Flp pilus assembly protein TadG
MVEFALVVFAFLLVMFAAVSAAFHSIQRANAETAAAAGVQLAASGSAADPMTPAYAASFAPTRDLLQPVMFGTAIVQGADEQACKNAAASPPPNQLTVCAYPDGPNLVAERVVGKPNYIIPFIAQWLPWSIDVTVEMHQVTYQR